MKSILILFGDSTDAAAKGKALAMAGWHVVVTGPTEGTEIRQDGDFVAKLASSWAVFASQQRLQDPDAD